MPRFVLHQHDTGQKHFDLRFERGDRVVTWALLTALPKPRDSFGATRLEDRSGRVMGAEVIVEDRLGAGSVEVLDGGGYVVGAWNDDRVEVRLRGERLRWGLTLNRVQGDDWSVTGRE